MDQRDRQSLDRSSGRIQPADRTLALSAVALFLAGMTLGGFLVANKNRFSQLDDVVPGTASPDMTLPIVDSRSSIPMARRYHLTRQFGHAPERTPQ